MNYTPEEDIVECPNCKGKRCLECEYSGAIKIDYRNFEKKVYDG